MGPTRIKLPSALIGELGLTRAGHLYADFGELAEVMKSSVQGKSLLTFSHSHGAAAIHGYRSSAPNSLPGYIGYLFRLYRRRGDLIVEEDMDWFRRQDAFTVQSLKEYESIRDDLLTEIDLCLQLRAPSAF